MRLARLAIDGTTKVAVSVDEVWLELDLSWREALAHCAARTPLVRFATGQSWTGDQVDLLAPVDEVSRGVFCIGMNYAKHADEASAALGGGSQRPAIFLKLASSLIGPGAPIAADPGVSAELDWEVELGVVIGRGGRRIAPEDVPGHIAGYTVINDVSARDLQRNHVQWFMGKNVERCSPIGPWVITAETLPFPPALQISLSVNGVEKQRDNTDRLVWSIAQFVSMVSDCVHLESGDIFATGTPAGVGFSRDPAEFLRAGDRVSAKIERIGVLENVVE